MSSESDSDVTGASELDRENILFSRALAAFALSIEAEVEPEKAASSLVDGFNDNGIDAIYFSPVDKILYICQSKWSSDGSSIIDQGSAQKFVNGVQDILSLRFERFNSKFTRRKNELSSAINSAGHISIIVASSGSGTIGDHPKRALEDYVEELNDTGEVAHWTLLNQERLYTTVSQGGRSDPVDLEIQMFDWGQQKRPTKHFTAKLLQVILHPGE